MKVLTIVGARPQFIKAFPVSEAIRKRHEDILVHTGQHYDEGLSDVFFEELPIPEPDYNLGIGSGTHADQTAMMMRELDDCLDEESPDVVLVYGDTNSTLAGALVTAKREPTLVHVEAGLRSGDRTMPEEVNRIITDHVSDRLCTPSERATDQLAREGITDGISQTGDVMYDSLLYVESRALNRSSILDDLDLRSGEYVLATVHRASNTDSRSRLESIIEGLADGARPVVFPAHPRTIDALQRYDLLDRAREALLVIDPVGYIDFIKLVAEAETVATDSGGIQKEAFYLGTPCVTLRKTTEWVETVECGWNVLVGAQRDAITAALRSDPPAGKKPDLYGNGKAAQRVLDVIDSL